MLRHQCPHPYHQTKRRRLIEKALLIGVLIGLGFFFILGRYSVKGVEVYQAENATLSEAVEQLTAANKEFIKQQDFIENAQKIDSQAQKGARRALLKLHDELSDVKEQLAFYQHVVAPETVVKGLYISSMEIKKVADDGSYQYQLILAQGVSQKRAVKGKYSIGLVGMLDGQEKELLLVKDTTEGFSFRYYQILTDEVVLPSGFVPKQLKVSVKQSVKNSKAITQVRSWSDVTADSSPL